MKELTLNQIALWCGAPTAQEYNSVRVTGVCSDSREVRAGDLFIALPGERTDGHAYVAKAAEAGAAAALVPPGPEALDPLEVGGERGALPGAARPGLEGQGTGHEPPHG